MAMEIVSLGGRISYILRVPTKHKELVQTSFYANYPEMEMIEIEDYLKNFDYDYDNGDIELFGADFILVKDQSFPIRTYKEFEGFSGPETSQIIVDPIAPLLETLTQVNSTEFLGYQIVIQPVLDGSWQDKVEAQVEKLQGEKDFMQLDEVTKDQINSLRRKLGRPGFYTKIRVLHMGKKGSFHKDFKKLVLSPFRIYGSASFNIFKPTFATKKDWMISPSLEKPYIEHWRRKRYAEIFAGYKKRSTWIGSAKYILNTEELATLFHFPITQAISKTPISAIDMKKVQPPIDLPIDDNY
ncbi:MAG: hypothetical protein R3B41_03065 [Candidatus Doudnabacteria bacterium]